MGVGKTLADKIRISLAIGLFVERSVSLERAAELAGQPLGHFIDILRSKGISWAEYTEEMMGQDEFAVKKFLEETGSRHE
ncbi:MAG: hypothetical protein HPY81_10175 [Firmicutes bacterium]|nr:hypothetical protein [Bacillota bacterium]